MPAGAAVDVEQPKGQLRPPEDTSKRFAFIAGGHRHHALPLHAPLHRDKGLDYDVTLVYSNRDVESTAFLDELNELEKAIPGMRLVCTMTEDDTWEGDTRMLDANVLRDILGDLESFHFMIAGAAADGEVRRGLAARGGSLRRPGSVGLVQRLLGEP
jgi:ferredoxin-NADP reductase